MMSYSFSDEKMFTFGSEGVKLWKRKHEKPFYSHVPMERSKWMVWGAVWKGGKSDLYITQDTIDSEEYQCILWDYLIDPHHEEYLQHMRLLQDNARPHISLSTYDFVDNFGVEHVTC